MFGVGLGVAATIAVQTANVEVLRSFEESVLTVAGEAFDKTAKLLGLGYPLGSFPASVKNISSASHVNHARNALRSAALNTVG